MKLNEICGGALQEVFDVAFLNVIENVMDPNTDPKAARKVTIELKIKPDEKRSIMDTTFSVKPMLAPVKSFGTIMQPTFKDGHYGAKEIGSNLPGQVEMSNVVEIKEAK